MYDSIRCGKFCLKIKNSSRNKISLKIKGQKYKIYSKIDEIQTRMTKLYDCTFKSNNKDVKMKMSSFCVCLSVVFFLLLFQFQETYYYRKCFFVVSI